MKKISKYILTEGKHWPEDYVKTAFNAIKSSELGKQNWYTDNYINQNLKTFVDEFSLLSHKNSNLGYFATIIRWFIEFSGKDVKKYQEFVERKFDGIIRTLLWLSNNPGEETKIKDQLKTKWSFEDFEKFQKSIEDRINAEQTNKLKNAKLEDKGYEIIKIDSYEQLHKLFGGNKTGYNGESEWCHTNGESTYDSWTGNGKYNFFVLAKKGWEKIEPPDPKTTNAYDEYGTSLIAILVDIANTQLKNATLRWNHIIDPSKTKPGTSVDKAFLGWGDLAEITGKNIENEIKEATDEERKKLQQRAIKANREVEKILKNVDKIERNTFEKYKIYITKINIPNNVTKIGYYAFSNCTYLTAVTIPNSVTSIGDLAFHGCERLKTVTIPNSVINIDDWAFRGCRSLTSITIPDSVTSIGDMVFYGCNNLKTVYCSEKIWNEFRDKFPEGAEIRDISEAPKNESKKFKIKNYKGNLIESLERFSRKYNFKIVEVSNVGNELKIKAL